MTEDKIKNWLDKWQYNLGLHEWMINVEIAEKNDPEDSRCEISIEDDLKYLEADLTIYPAFWEHDSQHQEINLVHELVHLVLCPLHPYIAPAGDDVLEGIVQKIAINAFKRQQ